MQNRWKSKVVWAGLVTLILGTLVQLGYITPTQSETLNNAVAGILDALTFFAVLNNPTNKKGF